MNPLQMAFQMAQAGKNPMGVLQNAMGSNPQLAQAMKMIEGKSPEQLRTIATNMAKERGMDLGQVAQNFGLHLPS